MCKGVCRDSVGKYIPETWSKYGKTVLHVCGKRTTSRHQHTIQITIPGTASLQDGTNINIARSQKAYKLNQMYQNSVNIGGWQSIQELIKII